MTGLFSLMPTPTNTRPSWVWTALALQSLVLVLSVSGCVQVLAYWSRYAASGLGGQLIVREFIPAITIAVSLVGLWQTRRWGWIVAVITDSVLCARTLWFLLDYAAFAVRNAHFLGFNLWVFAALAVLLYQPVRGHFMGPGLAPLRGLTPLARTQPLRLLVYFAVAAVATCVAAAFSIGLLMSRRHEGSQAFGLLLYFGFTTGFVASLIFALTLTAAARRFGPSKLWMWLLLGGSLAPILIAAMAFMGGHVGTGLNFVFWGPETLVQAWWLTPPIGIFTAWICYAIYPWGFSPSRGGKRF